MRAVRRKPVLWCLGLLVVSSVAWQVPTAVAGAGQGSPPAEQGPPPPEQPEPARLSTDQLRRLVSPIALYPDALVAQILAASEYPTQIVEAERFLRDNPNLTGAALADAVNQQDWDPSVKALTEYPTVLDNMDKSLSWTSELGDANYNQPQDVADAIQYLRQQAEAAGNLHSTPQQTVTNQGNTINIQPANPQVVYVPEYNPALVYGYPIGLWPGFNPWWDITGPYISFGLGFGIGPFLGFGWGWGGWGYNWHHGGMFFGGRPYAFHSHAFYDHNAYFHGNFRGYAPFSRGDRGLRGYGPGEARNFGGRGAGGNAARGGRGFGAAGPTARGFRGSSPQGNRNFGQAARPGGGREGRSSGPAMRSWGRSGAFGGITRGGDARSFSSRGRSSMGGGMRGGGFHGGGSRGGGGRH